MSVKSIRISGKNTTLEVFKTLRLQAQSVLARPKPWRRWTFESTIILGALVLWGQAFEGLSPEAVLLVVAIQWGANSAWTRATWWVFGHGRQVVGIVMLVIGIVFVPLFVFAWIETSQTLEMTRQLGVSSLLFGVGYYPVFRRTMPILGYL